MKQSIYLLSMSTLLCTASSPLAQKQESAVCLTIFVHGALRAQLARCSFFKVMTDSIENSTYKRAVCSLRSDPLFHQLHAMQEPGLKKIDLTSCSGAAAIAKAYEEITTHTTKAPSITYYYTFGWSGLLSNKARYEDATTLYKGLIQEIQDIRKRHGMYPRIRIIAYSHGGNVCLHLAQVKRNEISDLNVLIDELILIGMPVQKETDYLVADPLFQKVYHFYSLSDQIQTSDFFSFKRFFSHRTFHNRSGFTVPDNLVQVRIKTYKYMYGSPNRYAQTIPEKIDPHGSPRCKRVHMSPGHMELWYLGFTDSGYRQSFPLYPFPLVSFVSYFVHLIEENQHLKNNITLSIHPQKELIYIHKSRSRSKKVLPFITVDTLKQIRTKIEHQKTYCQDNSQREKELVYFARTNNNACIRTKTKRGVRHRATSSPVCCE